jgi:hypothetical protein
MTEVQSGTSPLSLQEDFKLEVFLRQREQKCFAPHSEQAELALFASSC